MFIQPFKLNVQEVLLMQQGLELKNGMRCGDLRTDFEKDLYRLGREYEVEVMGAVGARESLGARPLHLHLTPRGLTRDVDMRFRITGILTEASIFKPVLVDLNPQGRCRPRVEFSAETESAGDLVAHAHRALSLLRHTDHALITLQA